MSNIQTQIAWEQFAIDGLQDRLEEYYQDEKEPGPEKAWQEFCFLLDRAGYPYHPCSVWDLDKDRQTAYWELLQAPGYGFEAWLDRRFETLPDGGEFEQD